MGLFLYACSLQLYFLSYKEQSTRLFSALASLPLKCRKIKYLQWTLLSWVIVFNHSCHKRFKISNTYSYHYLFLKDKFKINMIELFSLIYVLGHIRTWSCIFGMNFHVKWNRYFTVYINTILKYEKWLPSTEGVQEPKDKEGPK